jgi:hypothetical protein
MKIPEFKRSGIRLIAEFHGITSGFPNQVQLPLKIRRHVSEERRVGKKEDTDAHNSAQS